MIDYGEEHNLIWVVALHDSGEIWCSPNPKIRMALQLEHRGAAPAANAA